MLTDFFRGGKALEGGCLMAEIVTLLQLWQRIFPRLPEAADGAC
jgi:hypothetical protein